MFPAGCLIVPAISADRHDIPLSLQNAPYPTLRPFWWQFQQRLFSAFYDVIIFFMLAPWHTRSRETTTTPISEGLKWAVGQVSRRYGQQKEGFVRKKIASKSKVGASSLRRLTISSFYFQLFSFSMPEYLLFDCSVIQLSDLRNFLLILNFSAPHF